MGASVPDVALLVAGLDELASPLLAALPTVQFRVNIVRTQCQIDHSPTFEGVQSFARSLQAEMEAAAIGQPEETLQRSSGWHSWMERVMVLETEVEISLSFRKQATQKGVNQKREKKERVLPLLARGSP